MRFLRPIWTFFGTRAPGIEVMVTLRDPDQARCRLACRSCRTRGRKERALSSPTFAPIMLKKDFSINDNWYVSFIETLA